MQTSFKEYIQNHNNIYIQIVECVDNNICLVTENELLVNHGKDIDSIMNKFRRYTYNNIYGNIYESQTNDRLTLSESKTAQDLLIYTLERYRDELFEELSEYEYVLENGFDTINEELKVVKYAKKLWGAGKEKIKNAVETVKTKIKEVGDMIKEFATKAIKSIKDMAKKLVQLLVKFDWNMKDFFTKISPDADEKEEENEYNELTQDVVNNPDKIAQNDVYESLGKEVEQYILLNEADATENTDNEAATKANVNDKNGEKQISANQGEKKGWKAMLIKGLKQLAIWALVCVVIPGFITFLFPGTFIALLVPLVCKICWNAYKIKKLIQQWKEVKKDWKTYSKTQKVLTAIGMIASIVALVFNFIDIASKGGTIINGLIKHGGGLLEKANLGISPDALTKGFAAFCKMISEGKFNMQDFMAGYKEIQDSFQSEIGLKIAKVTAKATKTTAKIGQSGEELLKQFNSNMAKTPTGAWYKLIYPNSLNPAEAVKKIADNSVVDVVMDGSDKADWCKKLFGIAKKLGYSESDLNPTKGFSSAIHKAFPKGGAITGFKLPGKLVKYLINNEVDLGHNSFKIGADGLMKGVGILGSSTEVISTSSVVKWVTKSLKFVSSMMVTIPIITVNPKNNGGFRVRLGEPGSENYVYEIGNDGIRFETIKDNKIKYIFDNNKKCVDTLMETKELKENEDKKKEILDGLKKFNEKYKENQEKVQSIVFYGTPVKEETEGDDKKENTTNTEKPKNEGFVNSDDKKENITNILEELKKEETNSIEDDKKKIIEAWEETADEVGISAIQKVFTKDQFEKPQLDIDFKRNVAKLIYLNLHIDYDKAIDFIESVHKLYTICAKNNKEIKDVEGSKDKNNDITLDEKILYNHIFDILYNGSDKFKKDFDNKNIDMLKPLKIKNKDSEEVQNAAKKIRTELENDKPKDTGNVDNISNEKVIKALKNETNEKTTESMMSLKDYMILEGITNKKIIDSLNNLCNWITNILAWNIKHDKKEETNAARNDGKENTSNTEDSKKEETNATGDNNKETTTNTENSKKEETKSKDDGKEKQVLILSQCYGYDVANADKNGPRKDPYPIKGLLTELEIILIEGGTPIDKIHELLGNILYDSVNNCWNLVIDKPCNNEDKNGKGKWIINEDSLYKEDQEREDFGKLTNKEITDILNNQKNAYKYIAGDMKSIKAAENENEEKQVEADKKDAIDKIKNDKEALDAAKKVNPKIVDDEGNIDDSELETTATSLANYRLSQQKNKKKKGFFSRMWGKIKNFFTGNKDDMDSLNSKIFDSYQEEEHYDFDDYINENIKNDKFVSLSEYIKYKSN